MIKEKRHLGVCQINSNEKNYAIVLTQHEKHGEGIVKKQVVALVCYWKGRHKERAYQLKEQYFRFLYMSPERQKQEIENAKKLLQENMITEFSETEYGTKTIFKL